MLADEILVIRDGQVLQSGSCREVYRRPRSVEVGRLLGIDNLFEGVAGPGGVVFGGGNVPVRLPAGLSAGTRLLWQVPPEALRVSQGRPPLSNGSTIALGNGWVTDVVDLGRTVEVVVELAPRSELRARAREVPGISVGDPCWLEAEAEAVSVWPAPAPAAPESGAAGGGTVAPAGMTAPSLPAEASSAQ